MNKALLQKTICKNPDSLTYDYEVAEDICKKTGMKFDCRLADSADLHFSAARLNQDQVDRMLVLHCSIIASLFDRKNYRWYHRLALAFYWLGVGKRIKSNG